MNDYEPYCSNDAASPVDIKSGLYYSKSMCETNPVGSYVSYMRVPTVPGKVYYWMNESDVPVMNVYSDSGYNPDAIVTAPYTAIGDYMFVEFSFSSSAVLNFFIATDESNFDNPYYVHLGKTNYGQVTDRGDTYYAVKVTPNNTYTVDFYAYTGTIAFFNDDLYTDFIVEQWSTDYYLDTGTVTPTTDTLYFMVYPGATEVMNDRDAFYFRIYSQPAE